MALKDEFCGSTRNIERVIVDAGDLFTDFSNIQL